MEDALAIDRLPDLHNPIAVVAFSGWNDAANVATDAASFLIKRLGARRFARIDAEDFYDFRDDRPAVAIDNRGRRSIAWPKNEFFFARNPTGPHDLVIATGVEPNLAWRAFIGHHVRLYRQLSVTMVVSLGAMLADVPHTRPTRVTGTAVDPEVAAGLDMTVSRYEGPTGIVGVLHDELRRQALHGATLWANVPHYITTNQNPRATAALVARLQAFLGVRLDLRELEAAGDRFEQEVTTALAANPEVGDYIRGLEERIDTDAESEPLPHPSDLLLGIEKFLRRQRNDDPGNDKAD